MIEDDFYATLKLKSGEEIFAKVAASDEENRIMLIEDCAQAHYATWQGRVAGSFGQAGAYSFYPTKNLGAVGDAGMLVTNNSVLAKKVRQLRNYGQSKRYLHPVIGMNSRLDEVQAAMLSERMKWLPEFTKRRRQIADSYHSKIDNPLVKPPPHHTHQLQDLDQL